MTRRVGADAEPIEVSAGVYLGLERVDERKAEPKPKPKPGQDRTQSNGRGWSVKTDDSAARSLQAAHVHL